MDNTLNNYQPDNQIFWNLFTAVLCLVFGFFYATYRAHNHGNLSRFDWIVLAILFLGMTYLFKNALKDRSSS